MLIEFYFFCITVIPTPKVSYKSDDTDMCALRSSKVRVLRCIVAVTVIVSVGLVAYSGNVRFSQTKQNLSPHGASFQV